MLTKTIVSLTTLLLAFGLTAKPSRAEDAADWHARLEQLLPLLGHRNWILIVDSAYPLQSSPGVETLETNAEQLEVLRTVLEGLDHSIHVRPNVYMDAELPFVPEKDAPGVTAYREAVKALLAERSVQSLPHEELLSKVDASGKTYNILILKTRMTVPYTSVFLQLDCKYWSAAAEAQLRKTMSQNPHK